MTGLSTETKDAVRKYLIGNNITLMAQSTLYPVIDDEGKLNNTIERNLGAGELIPTMFRSGVAEKLKIEKDSVVVFSNIDFDLEYIDTIAAWIESNRPDLLQVHVKSEGKGGSAYKFTDKTGRTRTIPLEGIEVSPEMLKQTSTLNTNTAVLSGRALQPELYKQLPIPFESKEYHGRKFWLPKVSLADIGKIVRTGVALGDPKKVFYTGSKDMAKLLETGVAEAMGRISRWNQQVRNGMFRSSMMCNKSHSKVIGF
jgi:hypothetical protein